MAKVLKKKGISPDLILTSSAKRAYEFALTVAEELGYKKKNIVATKDIYMADEKEMLDVIRDIDNSVETAFMFGHNPGITYFANSLCNYNLDNIPTSGVFCIEFDTDKWKNIDYGKGKFVSFDYPKKYY